MGPVKPTLPLPHTRGAEDCPVWPQREMSLIPQRFDAPGEGHMRGGTSSEAKGSGEREELCSAGGDQEWGDNH